MENDTTMMEDRSARTAYEKFAPKPDPNEPLPQDPAARPVSEGPVPETSEENTATEHEGPMTGGPVPAGAAAGTPQAPAPGKKGNAIVRACGTWADILPIAIVLSVLIVFYGEFIQLGIIDRIFPINQWASSVFQNEAAGTFLYMYFSTAGGWIAIILVITVFSKNRPMWKALLYNGHGNNIRSIFIGILLGGGMNGACVFLSWLNGDISLSFNEFKPALFFVFLLCVMIQSGSEEIIDRLYFYQKLRRRYRHPAVAILVNSAVFMALHMLNPGVTKLGLFQVFEIGMLFSLIVYYYDSLWTAIWAHTAWNFSQSIVFGLPNSGLVSGYSVFKLDAANARDGLFYNTSFGVEGSPGACAIIAVVCVLVLIAGLVGGGGERKDYWKRMEEDAEVSAPKVKPWEGIIWAVLVIGGILSPYLPQIIAEFS